MFSFIYMLDTKLGGTFVHLCFLLLIWDNNIKNSVLQSTIWLILVLNIKYNKHHSKKVIKEKLLPSILEIHLFLEIFLKLVMWKFLLYLPANSIKHAFNNN